MDSQPAEAPLRSRVSLVTFLLILGGVLFLTVRMVRPYLLAVFMGGILALLAYPAYRKLRVHNWGARTAALIVTLSVVLLVIGPLSTFVTLAVKQAIVLGGYLAEREGFSFPSLAQKITQLGPLSDWVGDPESLERQIRQYAQRGAQGLTGLVVGLAGALPELGLQLALASIACFFLLMDGRKFLVWLESKVPLDRDVRAKINGVFKDTAISTIWATLAAAGAQAAMMLTAFLALGVPAAILAAGATFVFAWIPILGSFPVWMAGAVYLWTQGSIAKAIAMIAIGLLTSVVDNFIRPLVLKGRSQMHPLVALIAIFGGIHMFGIFGVFIGPIVMAILTSLIQIWPVVGRRDGIAVEGHPASGVSAPSTTKEAPGNRPAA